MYIKCNTNQTMDVQRSHVPSSGRPSRAFKVAGITLLAGVLIVGQAVIAYVLISQQSDIKSLEKQNNKLEVDLKNGNSGEAKSYEMYTNTYRALQVLVFLLS